MTEHGSIEKPIVVQTGDYQYCQMNQETANRLLAEVYEDANPVSSWWMHLTGTFPTQWEVKSGNVADQMTDAYIKQLDECTLFDLEFYTAGAQ